MNISETILFETISSHIQDLNRELEVLNNLGIFFSPELYVAFLCGKEITRNKENIFRDGDIIWEREKSLGKEGPSDLLFYTSVNEHLRPVAVFEFKLRDTYDAYKADVEKLLRVQYHEVKKYFCVLLDSFTKSNDERLQKLEYEFSEHLTRINQVPFPTKQNWYKKQVYCVLNLYSVG